MRAALERLEVGERVVLATVLRRRGSTPSTPGQKLALLDSRRAVGTVGGGAIELTVVETMIELLEGGDTEPRIERYDLGPTMGMCCGGSVEVLIEVLEPALSVLLVGAGHIGTFLGPLLASLGFQVTVVDGREQVVEAAQGMAGPRLRVIHGAVDDPEVAAALTAPPESSAALVMTHDHQLDQVGIEWALKARFGLVGGVGSRAKAARTRARLEAKDVSAADVGRVRMPLGTEIGARSPAEIAVSIAGELIGWRAELLSRSRRPIGDLQVAVGARTTLPAGSDA